MTALRLDRTELEPHEDPGFESLSERDLGDTRVSIDEAAWFLGLSLRAMRWLVLSRRLRGGRERSVGPRRGRWYLVEEDLLRFARERAQDAALAYRLAPDLPANERVKACPRCGMACTLDPLRRAGAYRLIDGDGGPHLAVCLAPRREPRRSYHPRSHPASPAWVGAPAPRHAHTAKDVTR